MFYAVRVGLIPGIYTDWAQTEIQVKGFPNAEFKRFKTLNEAQIFLDQRSGGYEIWTDGGAKLHKKAGYGLVVVKDGQIVYQEYGKVGKPYTNSHAEVMGVYMAIYYVLKHLMDKEVTILSDSEYVVKTLTVWGPQRKNWKGKAYADEFQEILEVLKDLNVKFQHVPAHSGLQFNERADQLATMAMKIK